MSLLRIFSKKCNNDQELEKNHQFSYSGYSSGCERQKFIMINHRTVKHFCVHIIPSAGLDFSGVEIKSPLEVVKADNTLI